MFRENGLKDHFRKMNINSSSKIKKFIFNFLHKFKGKKFIYLFNFLSFILRSKNRINFHSEFYYCTEKEWRFFNKPQGLYAYVKGFQKRKIDLSRIYLIKKLDFKDKDVIIDIGANNGDFYLCFDKKINYYGFEPSPVVYSNLEYNIKNQNLFNKAVWKSEEENLEFYLKDEFGDSSIIPIKNFSEKISIQAITLDKIIDKIKNPIKLIKIEAEGAEPEILQGLKKNIPSVEYITIDCGFERGVEEQSTISDCSNYLIQNGFEFIDFGYPRIVALFRNKNVNYNK